VGKIEGDMSLGVPFSKIATVANANPTTMRTMGNTISIIIFLLSLAYSINFFLRRALN
jgi:hypothetical protein